MIRCPGGPARSRDRGRWAWALAALVLPWGAGCTVLLGGVGAMSDHYSPKRVVLWGSDFDGIGKGTRLEVLLKDGTTRRGHFLGLEPLPELEYKTVLGERGPSSLPEFGDSITIELEWGQRDAARFAGVDPGAILVSHGGVPGSHDLRVVQSVQVVARETRFRLSGDSLRTLAARPDWPVRTSLILGQGTHRGAFRETLPPIPLSEIEFMSERARGQRGEAGVLVGAAIDVSLLMLLGHALAAGTSF